MMPIKKKPGESDEAYEARKIEVLKHNNELRFNNKEQPKIMGLRHLMSNLVRSETLDGDNYLVCPTVLICEGVHNGVFYPSSELAKFTDSWAGRPVVINHPDIMGKPITANSPAVVERQTVGAVYNVSFNEETGKLHGEVWIKIDKCETVSPEILTMLDQNQNIEVSTGLFTECDMEAGKWNEEEFTGTVCNYRPDHLALLPNDKGACSWEDGAGTPRINKKEEEDVKGKIGEMFKALAEGIGLAVNEASHDDIRMALRDAIVTGISLGKDEYLFVRDVYDKHVIYGVENNNGKAQLFKQGYSLNASDEIELVGERVEVKPHISYVPVTNEQKGEATKGPATNKGGSVMLRSQMITALIAVSDWGEDDSEMLTNMSDEQFKKVHTPFINEEGEAVKPEAAPGAEGAEGAVADKGKAPEAAPAAPAANVEKETVADVIVNLKAQNPEAAATLERAIARDEEIKANMIKELSENKACPYSADEMSAMGLEGLQKLLTLSGSVKSTVDYSAAAPAAPTANAESGVPAMPVVCAQKKD
jgi:hypothetical protein